MVTEEGVSSPDCPYCELPVEAIAEQCPHCGSLFFEGKTKDGRALTPYGASGRELYANLLLFLPLLIVLSIWALVAAGLMGQGKFDFMLVRTMLYRLQFEGGLVMTVLLALLVGIEAWRLGIGGRADLDRRNIRRSGPIHWLLFTLFIWPLSLPAYLSWRSRYGLKNRFFLGLALVLALFGSVYAAGTITNNHPAFQLADSTTPASVPAPQITAAQAELQARTAIKKMQRALGDTFFQNRQYPFSANDFYSGFRAFDEKKLTLVYVSGGKDFYQLIVFHAQGENDFLVRAGDTEIYSFPHSDVVADLTSKYGPAAINRQGNLFFILNIED